jgi:hypothetical protein
MGVSMNDLDEVFISSYKDGKISIIQKKYRKTGKS